MLVEAICRLSCYSHSPDTGNDTMIKRIDDPMRFFNDLGNLHDARVSALNWDECAKSLSISVDDLHANFSGFPEYQGCQPQTIVLENIGQMEISIENFQDRLNVDEFVVSATALGALMQVDVKFWPVGNIHVTCESIGVGD
jgi:hypothetical protein